MGPALVLALSGGRDAARTPPVDRPVGLPCVGAPARPSSTRVEEHGRPVSHVGDELWRIAHRQLARTRPEHTPVATTHEAVKTRGSSLRRRLFKISSRFSSCPVVSRGHDRNGLTVRDLGGGSRADGDGPGDDTTSSGGAPSTKTGRVDRARRPPRGVSRRGRCPAPSERLGVGQLGRPADRQRARGADGEDRVHRERRRRPGSRRALAPDAGPAAGFGLRSGRAWSASLPTAGP
jgi:hypothetical protein